MLAKRKLNQWFAACRADDINTVNKLYDSFVGSRDPIETQEMPGFTGLHYAAFYNASQVFRRLFSAEIGLLIDVPLELEYFDINGGQSALHIAILCGNAELVTIAIELGAPHPRDEFGLNSLCFLAIKNRPVDLSVFKAHFDYFATELLDMEGIHPAQAAVSYGSVMFARIFGQLFRLEKARHLQRLNIRAMDPQIEGLRYEQQKAELALKAYQEELAASASPPLPWASAILSEPQQAKPEQEPFQISASMGRPASSRQLQRQKLVGQYLQFQVLRPLKPRVSSYNNTPNENHDDERHTPCRNIQQIALKSPSLAKIQLGPPTPKSKAQHASQATEQAAGDQKAFQILHEKSLLQLHSETENSEYEYYSDDEPPPRKQPPPKSSQEDYSYYSDETPAPKKQPVKIEQREEDSYYYSD